MTKEEIKEVFFEEKRKVVKRINENKDSISLADIDQEIFSIYKGDGKLNAHRFDSVYGEMPMKAELYEHYIIMCSVFELIPKVGYIEWEGEDETAEETC